MKGKKLFAVVAAAIAVVSWSGSTAAGAEALWQNVRVAQAASFPRLPISEPASLVLFGAALWAAASVRRRSLQ